MMTAAATTPVRVRLLGGVQISGDVASTPTRLEGQPKRTAILAYLALSEPEVGHRRDHLLGVFWPESDAAHGRNALSQHLYHLRRLLGTGALSRDGGETVRLDPAAVWVDAAAFEAAAAAHRDAEALALYTGALLPGFFVSGAPAFEQWLETTRARLCAQAIACGLRVVEAEGAMGRAAEAAAVSARLISWDPTNEQVVRAHMTWADAAGHRAVALRAFDALAVRLHDDLDVEPSAETTALAQHLKRAAPVTPSAPTVATTPAPTPTPARASAPAPALVAPAPSRRGRLVALLTIAVAVFFIAMRESTDVPADPARLAVLPFDVDGAAPELRFLGEGMMDLVAMRLGPLMTPHVEPPSLVLDALGHGPDGARAPTLRDAIGVSRRLGTGRLLMGRIGGSPRRLVVSASLYDVAADAPVAAASVDGPLDSLPWLVEQVAQRLLVSSAREAPVRLADLTSTSIDALSAFLTGRALFRHGRLAEAAAAFGRATRADSTFALAAIEGARASRWASDDAGVSTFLALADRHQARLSPADRAYLRASREQWVWEDPARQLQMWSHVLGWFGDAPDVRFEHADALLHGGGAAGRDDAREVARAELAMVVRLDSAFQPALYHLLEQEHIAGHPAAVRQLRDRYLAADSTGEIAFYVKWRAALALGDSGEQRRLRAQFTIAPLLSLQRVLLTAQLDGFAIADATEALEVMRTRAATDTSARRVFWYANAFFGINTGHTAQARRDAREQWALEGEEDLRVETAVTHLVGAAYADGDSGLAAEAVRAMTTPAHPLRDPKERALARCAVAGWQVETGSDATIRAARAAVQQVRWPRSASPFMTRRWQACAAWVAAAAAQRLGVGEDTASMSTLERLLAEDPYESRQRLILVVLHARAGRPARALALARRERIPYVGWAGVWQHAELLQWEARLARQLGDTARAKRAMQELAQLRSYPVS